MRIFLNGAVEAAAPVAIDEKTLVASLIQIFPSDYKDKKLNDRVGVDVKAPNKFAVDFKDFHAGSDSAELIESLINLLTALACTFVGSITYYGDYNGRYELDSNLENGYRCLTEDECAVEDADDDDLARQLESRGYIVCSEHDDVKDLLTTMLMIITVMPEIQTDTGDAEHDAAMEKICGAMDDIKTALNGLGIDVG